MSLIAADNTWLMWMAVAALGAFSLWSEQKTKWGAKVGMAIVAIFGTMLVLALKKVSPIIIVICSAIAGIACGFLFL